MTMKLSLYAGAVAVALGLLFLFMPIESAVAADCGNAFGGADPTASCGAAKGERWMLILSLLGLGAAAVFAALDYRANDRGQADATA